MHTAFNGLARDPFLNIPKLFSGLAVAWSAEYSTPCSRRLASQEQGKDWNNLGQSPLSLTAVRTGGGPRLSLTLAKLVCKIDNQLLSQGQETARRAD